MYPWTWLPTEKDLNPTNGRGYVEVDGAPNFARVKAAHAAPAGGEPGLRIYRAGPYGSLVGKRVDARRLAPAATTATASIQNVAHFGNVDPKASRIEWAWNIGSITGARDSEAIAVALNGTVVAVTAAQPPKDGTAPFTFVVPPTLVRAGTNDVAVYLVDGPESRPQLRLVRVAR
jgi:hypothetical protein